MQSTPRARETKYKAPTSANHGRSHHIAPRRRNVPRENRTVAPLRRRRQRQRSPPPRREVTTVTFHVTGGAHEPRNSPNPRPRRPVEPSYWLRVLEPGNRSGGRPPRPGRPPFLT